jgi:hypothetical protein
VCKYEETRDLIYVMKKREICVCMRKVRLCGNVSFVSE